MTRFAHYQRYLRRRCIPLSIFETKKHQKVNNHHCSTSSMSRQVLYIAIVVLLVSNSLSYPFRDSSETKSKLAKRLLAESAKESKEAKHLKAREFSNEEIDYEGECHDIDDQHNCMFVMLNIKPCDAYYRKNCAESCGECYYKRK